MSDAASSSQPGSQGPRREVYGNPPEAKSMTRYIKPSIYGVLALYALIILLLNRNTTEINFLFFTANLPLIVALGLMFILGGLTGWGLVSLRARNKRKLGQASGKKK